MTLERTLECFAEGVGRQVGDLVRCLVQAEMASHIQRIEQLQAVLSGQNCTPAGSVTTDGEPPAS